MICFHRLIMKHMQQLSRLTTVFALLSLLFTSVGLRSALAHERVELGPYVVVVGWVKEPAIVGERNALFLQITENGEPVEGVAATLDAQIQYGGRTFRSNLVPYLSPGEYTIEIFPTVRGQYSVRLFGAIEDLEVDELVDPEEVFPASRLQFPETQSDPLELQQERQQEMAELQTQLKLTRIIALVGIGIGTIGIALAAISLQQRS